MPTYDYKCYDCGVIEQVMHGMSETPDVVCSACETLMRKKITFNDVTLKGEGFYSTDSRGA